MNWLPKNSRLRDLFGIRKVNPEAEEVIETVDGPTAGRQAQTARLTVRANAIISATYVVDSLEFCGLRLRRCGGNSGICFWIITYPSGTTTFIDTTDVLREVLLVRLRMAEASTVVRDTEH